MSTLQFMATLHFSATRMATRMVVRAAGACPKAPSAQVQTYANDILGWVKWGVLAILGVCFFASIGMIIWGRATHHAKGARLGFDGLMICLLGAVLYVAGYTVITGITGC